jgi:hypothetical protein
MISGEDFLASPQERALHQVWLGGAPPARLRPYLRSWTLHHDVCHVLWSTQAALRFFRKHFPAKLGFFCSLESPVQKCDYLRLHLLYEFGGCYADCDMECKQPLLPELFAGSCPIVLLRSPLFTEEYTNCFMIARLPQEPFWLDVADTIEATVRSVRDGSGVSAPLAVYFRLPVVSRMLRLCFTAVLTGPGCLDRTLARDHYDVVTLPPDRFYDGAASTHHEAADWFSLWDLWPVALAVALVRVASQGW